MKSEAELREEMVAAGRLLWERNLLGATEGNLSCRLDPERLLCTPSGFSKGHLKEADLVEIDLNGVPFGQPFLQPSSEIRVHLRLYERRPEVQAVVHAHPLTATAYASAWRALAVECLPEAIVVLGDVALVPFAMPGTSELPDALEPFIGARAFLLANHGAVTTGDSLMDAAYRMETMERVAEILYRAEQLGGARPLTEDAVRRLRAMGDYE